MSFIEWYNTLAKPSWTPDPAFIGLMWQILYPIILLTFSFVFIQALRKKIPAKVCIPFVVNLIANIAFTPIQFGLRNLPLATLDIIILWGSIIWLMIAIWRYYRVVALLQLPYLAWVSVASVLQILITLMNL